MAHECPECGSKCHCNGDIDDIVFDDDAAGGHCTCCICPQCHRTYRECECEEYENPED